MIVVSPNTSATGSVRFSVRTRPTSSLGTFVVRMNYINEENQKSGSVTVTASYSSTDFLNVTASLYASASNFYSFQLIQMSGSVECNELYRGELLPTTSSATIVNSQPLFSYTGSNDTFIIYSV
jgi:hypothetical protein